MLLRTMLLLSAASFAAFPAHAGSFQIGSGNEAVIEPPVVHPDETPCAVPLLVGALFENFNPATYSYTPSASCPGPWAKVVLSIDVSVTAGIQFDRTGLLFMNGVPLWFGTTAEPNPNLAPAWHFERDVTDYTALFEAPQTGEMDIGNVVNSTYTGIISASAELLFYPATAAAPAPVTADVVLPLPGTGGAGTLGSSTDTIALTTTFPRNVLKAKLDVYLQGQGGDEFWYTCVPNSLTGPLESCGGGALREGEITVDNMAAGVAPVFPWIFTGGLDPYLWAPIPGVQTLDFTPFTADLSPFAGVLSDGNPHTIAASVYGDDNYFQASGAVRLFLDHGATTVSGSVTMDTLQPVPTVTTTNSIVTNNGVTSGGVNTSDARDFTIEGSVTGSAGTTINTVKQTSTFANNQTFLINATQYQQSIQQSTQIRATSASTTNGVQTATVQTLNWPFKLAYTYEVGANGNSKQVASVNQNYIESLAQIAQGKTVAKDSLYNTITTGDTLYISSAGYIVGNGGQSETAKYLAEGTTTTCFGRILTAAANILTSAQTHCPAQ